MPPSDRSGRSANRDPSSTQPRQTGPWLVPQTPATDHTPTRLARASPTVRPPAHGEGPGSSGPTKSFFDFAFHPYVLSSPTSITHSALSAASSRGLGNSASPRGHPRNRAV